jgi:titin
MPLNVHQADSTTYAATSITLIWDAPADTGCSPITSYRIDRLNGATWVTAGTSTTTTGVATGLTAGQLVDLRVTALNGIAPNVGIPSATIRLTPSSLPNASTYIQVDTYSANSLMLSWDVPSNTGANNDSTITIVDYSLEVDEGFGSGFVRVTDEPFTQT